MFRLLFLTFTESSEELKNKNITYTKVRLYDIPLIVLAILSVVGGFINLPHFIGHGHYLQTSTLAEPIYVYDMETPEVPFY
jgi:NADH-quinone oxidoreductase subunit L